MRPSDTTIIIGLTCGVLSLLTGGHLSRDLAIAYLVLVIIAIALATKDLFKAIQAHKHPKN